MFLGDGVRSILDEEKVLQAIGFGVFVPSSALDELHSHDSTNEEHGRYSKGMDRKPTKRNDGVGEDTGHVSRSSIQ